jgi:TetR/AcrR family tetracycline transcriptional repressor
LASAQSRHGNDRGEGRLPPGPKPRLSRAHILDQALELLAEQGIDGLSIRKLAGLCQVTPMTLYGYFESKDALVDAIIAHVLPTPPAQRPQNRHWSALLRECVEEIQSAFAKYPGVAATLTARSLTDPRIDSLREYLLALINEAGVPAQDRVAVLGTIMRYIVGSAAIGGSAEHHGDSAERKRLRELPVAEFPELFAVADAYGERASPAAGSLGVELLILGIGAFAVRHQTS